MAELFGKRYTRREVEARLGRMNQVGGFSISRLEEGKGAGTRQALFRTGGGLEGTVFIDRALDLGNVQYKGMPLAFLSPAGEVHPSYYMWEGQGWERGWAGGLLTTCGLENFGPAGVDEGDTLSQHGRISHTPAERVRVEEEWEADEYVCRMKGDVHQAIPLKDHLILHRTLSFNLGESRITINDVVENRGFEMQPHMMLYHINIGFPILSENSRLVSTRKKVTPWNETAREYPDEFDTFDVPQVGYRDRQYRFDFTPDKSGTVTVGVINPSVFDGVAFVIRFKKEQLPDFNLWKMISAHDYVAGIEPMNAPFFHDGNFVKRADLRKRGILPFLEPGETRAYWLELSVIEGKKTVDDFRKSLE